MSGDSRADRTAPRFPITSAGRLLTLQRIAPASPTRMAISRSPRSVSRSPARSVRKIVCRPSALAVTQTRSVASSSTVTVLDCGTGATGSVVPPVPTVSTVGAAAGGAGAGVVSRVRRPRASRASTPEHPPRRTESASDRQSTGQVRRMCALPAAASGRSAWRRRSELEEVVTDRLLRIEADLRRVGAYEAAAVRAWRNGVSLVSFNRLQRTRFYPGGLPQVLERETLGFPCCTQTRPDAHGSPR